MLRYFICAAMLASGCLVVPERIPKEVADAGPGNDAGSVVWVVLPEENSLFGNPDDANADEPGFQVLLQVEGASNSELGIYDGDDLLNSGQTDDAGAASLEVTLAHGVQVLQLRAGASRLDRTLNIDLIGPTFSLTTSNQAKRMPEFEWDDLKDQDGVGADDGVTLEMVVDQGTPIPLTGDAGSQQISGLNIGEHQLLLRATDELGNTTELSRPLTVEFERFPTHHPNRYLLDGRPCAGDVNNDGMTDLAIIRNPASGVVPLPWILLGGAELDAEATKTLTIEGQHNAACLFAQVISGGGDELVVSTQGNPLDERDHSRFELFHWIGDRLDGDNFHTLTETGAPNGLAESNMAFFPMGLLNSDEERVDTLVLQTGTRFLRIFDVARFVQETPSGIGDAALNVQLASSDTMAGRAMVSGAFRQAGKQGIAIGGRRAGDNEEGAIWLIDEGLAFNQSYQLSDNPGNSQFHPAYLGGQEDAQAANLVTAMRFNDDAIDDVLAASEGDRRDDPTRLFVYVLGQEPTVLTVPEAVGDIDDLAACDLNGDGLDEISVAGRNGHQIRWGDGQWTTSPIEGGARYTLCAGDMTGDGLDDLVVTTRDTNKTVHILH